jgi:hypothetical protein
LRRNPDDARAWFVRGLILGGFLDAEGGEAERFDRARNAAAVAAFDEAILRQEDFTDARAFKARTLVRSCHAAQAGLRALAGAVQEMSQEEASEYLRPAHRTYQFYRDRTRDAFATALRWRSDDAVLQGDLAAFQEDFPESEGG